MSGERNFHPFWQKALSSSLTAPSEGSASTFGAHPRPETMLLFTGSLRSL